MNGFIYFETRGQHSVGDLDSLKALDPALSPREQSVLDGDSLMTWGNASGDIHFAKKGSDALLILCGYISELKKVRR